MSENNEILKNKDKSDKIEEEILSIPPENLKESKNGELKNKIICDFIIKQIIGEGTFATVRLAINRQTEEKVAIKIMEKNKISHEEDKIRVKREIQVLKKLRHPNIVHLYNVIDTKDKIYLITEYIKGIELFDYIVKKKKLSEKESCIFFQQIISGIEYLHKIKYVHRDIKPENILINEENNELKIVDFGLSNSCNNPNKNLLSSACGSPSYAAPEMLNGEKYKAPPVDVWSCGIVLYAMLCGYLPFEDENNDNDELYDKICKGKYTIPNHVSDKAKDLLQKILVTDPKRRFTILQIKNHPWFNLYNNKGKLMISDGLILTKYVIPIDEEIVKSISEKYEIDKEKIRISILSNKHDDISTLYYLLLNKKINKKGKSVADLKSNLFKKYCEDKNNLFEKYGKDLNNVLKGRKNGYIPEKESNQKIGGKSTLKKLKSKEEEIIGRRLNIKNKRNFSPGGKVAKIHYNEKINETDINVGRKTDFKSKTNNNSLRSRILKLKRDNNASEDIEIIREKFINDENESNNIDNNSIQESNKKYNLIKYKEKKVHEQISNKKNKINRNINNNSKRNENLRIKSAVAPDNKIYKKMNNSKYSINKIKNSIIENDNHIKMKLENIYEEPDRNTSNKKNKNSKLRTFKTPNKDIMKLKFERINKNEIRSKDPKNNALSKNLNLIPENISPDKKEKLIIKLIKENKDLFNKSSEESYKLFSILSKNNISESFYQKILNQYKNKKLKHFLSDRSRIQNNKSIKKEINDNESFIKNYITSKKKKTITKLTKESSFKKEEYSNFDLSGKKLCFEPFDLNLMYIKPRKNLREQIIFSLDKNKLKYRIINSNKFIIEFKKENASIDIKLEKLSLINEEINDKENGQIINIIKLKKSNGGYINYSKSLDKFLLYIN